MADVPPRRHRADQLLVARGLFTSRTRAQAAIAAGLVTADAKAVRKAAEPLASDAVLRAQPEHPFVSRGGVKLAAALDHFRFDPEGHVALDVGASTGGFSEVLLARGARRLYAVDVGHGQFHDRLRTQPEVVLLEATDIRALAPASLDPPPDFTVIDVSFISLRHVLPQALALMVTPGRLIALIKPAFEAGPGRRKNGLVRDQTVETRACEAVSALLAAQGWQVEGILPSPILGGGGSREFLLGARRD